MSYTQSWMDNPATQASLSLFSQPRAEGEVDLIEMVRDRLIKHGLVLQVQQHFDTDADIQQAANLGTAAQRHLLNRFWNFQFLSIGASTAEARFYLTDSGKPEAWIHVFDRFVLPAILENNLPHRLV